MELIYYCEIKSLLANREPVEARRERDSTWGLNALLLKAIGNTFPVPGSFKDTLIKLKG